MLVPLKPGMKIIGEGALAKIRECDETLLVKLYYHTNDPVQRVLIETICNLKGYKLVVEEPDNEPEPPRYA